MGVNNFNELTPEQQEVADWTARTGLVLGGAGVGKTTTALWAARRHLTRHGERAAQRGDDRVLFVTFSRTAVTQIRSRSSGVLDGIGDAVEIFTFHGLAYRLLRAFGQYIGLRRELTLTGESRSKVAGVEPGGSALAYTQLLPLAHELLKRGPVGALVRARWSLVICDEFQDTDDLEWQLLELLGGSARLLLLADPNQMIYQGFKPGVSEERLTVARERTDFVERQLLQTSKRDPSQVIPRAASDIRWRRFEESSVVNATSLGRMTVYRDVPDTDDARAEFIARLVRELQARGNATIGIYAKTNSDTAALSGALTSRKLDHVAVGFSEAYGEGLAALLALVEVAVGQGSWSDAKTAIAVALAANVRSPQAPPLALALHRGTQLPFGLEERLDRLRGDLENAGSLIEATQIASEAWETLGLLAGQRAWRRATRTFNSLVGRASESASDGLKRLTQSVRDLRDSSFVELDSGDIGSVQLMNFTQTKGREADAVILSFSSKDWYGRNPSEPYDEASRVLYVSITRGRNEVVVLLPPDPHPVVKPFLPYASLYASG